ncbi:MAG: hypothetical protein RR642_16665 [Solibacillus sp.]
MSKPKKADDNLKGTLYMTFSVGAIIIILWVFCFDLFMGRM